MKHSIRFITINSRRMTFAALCALAFFLTPRKAMACAWVETHNYYLFHVYDNEEFRNRVDRISHNNWKVYLGSSKDYYYFDAKETQAFRPS